MLSVDDVKDAKAEKRNFAHQKKGRDVPEQKTPGEITTLTIQNNIKNFFL